VIGFREGVPNRSEALLRISTRGRARAGVNDDPAIVRWSSDADSHELPRRLVESAARDVDRQGLSIRPRTDRRNEIELSANLMAPRPLSLCVANPAGQKSIGILAAVREPKRDLGQVAQHRGGKRVLRTDGEDDRCVESPVANRRDHPAVADRVHVRGALHPRSLVCHDLSDVREDRE
jgi:hypothetical protein